MKIFLVKSACFDLKNLAPLPGIIDAYRYQLGMKQLQCSAVAIHKTIPWLPRSY
jgi:hypothetical protein